MDFNKDDILMRQVGNHLNELDIDENWLKVLKDASAPCETPRRDGSPCNWCDSCYKKWQAERRNSIINHSQAQNMMMALYEEGRK